MTTPGSAQPNHDAAHWIAALTDSLAQQCDLYDRIDQLSQQQADLLDPEHATDLLRVLAQRDVAIAELTSINANAKPLIRRWSAEKSQATPAQQAAISGHLDHIEAAMASITRRDEEHFAVIQANKDRIARELTSAGNARTAVTAYSKAGSTQAKPRFKDQQG